MIIDAKIPIEGGFRVCRIEVCEPEIALRNFLHLQRIGTRMIVRYEPCEEKLKKEVHDAMIRG